MDNKHLHLLIDSRRPGEDGVPESEWAELLAGDERAAELYGRVQNADAAVSEAIRDVPVPEALPEKILASLKAARLGDELDSTDEAAVVRARAPEAAHREPLSTARRGRRSIWRMVAALSAAAACLALWIAHLQRPVNVSQEIIERDIDAVYEEELALTDPEWTKGKADEVALNVLEKFIHEDFRTVFRSRHLTVGGYNATAYDLLEPIPDNLPPQVRQQWPKRVTLIVIERRVAGLDYIPSSQPRNTHGGCLGVWQSKRFVYALMVEGAEEQYRGVLRQHSGVA